MARGRRHVRRLDPARVADGSVAVDLRELLVLIHEVNPTERGLHKNETMRRYALKNRLQSLLFRRFGDELEVVPERDGVVLLRHRYGAGDAPWSSAELPPPRAIWSDKQLEQLALQAREWLANDNPG